MLGELYKQKVNKSKIDFFFLVCGFSIIQFIEIISSSMKELA